MNQKDNHISHDEVARLFIFVQHALDPDNERIDLKMLAGVSDEGLRYFAGKMQEFLGYQLLPRDPSREELLHHINNMLDDFYARPAYYLSSGEVTINPAEASGREYDNSGVHPLSQKQEAIVLGPNGRVTDGALHESRRNLGWASVTWLSQDTCVDDGYVKTAIEKVRAAKIAAMTKTLAREYGARAAEEAEKWVQANYINKRSLRGVARHRLEPWDDTPRRVDYHVSEEAIPAVKAALQAMPVVQKTLKRRKDGWYSPSHVSEEANVHGGYLKDVRQAIKTARAAKIAEKTEEFREEHGKRAAGEAKKWVQDNYIHEAKMHGSSDDAPQRIEYSVSEIAMPEVKKAMQERPALQRLMSQRAARSSGESKQR